MNKYLFPFTQTFQHVLIGLIEEWRECLGNNFVVGGDFMDLSKAFHYIPNDLLIAKLEFYGFDDYLVQYLYSYLNNRKRRRSNK